MQDSLPPLRLAGTILQSADTRLLCLYLRGRTRDSIGVALKLENIFRLLPCPFPFLDFPLFFLFLLGCEVGETMLENNPDEAEMIVAK